MIDSGCNDVYDIAVIGGGINGCGIARDAVGRGLKAFLCDQADLGGNIPRTEIDETADALTKSYPFLPGAPLSRYLAAYGNDTFDLLS